jgi:hypothetical protein
VRVNFLIFNDVVFLVVDDVPVDSEACDFVNLDDLPAQYSKMLIRLGFACVHSQG